MQNNSKFAAAALLECDCRALAFVRTLATGRLPLFGQYAVRALDGGTLNPRPPG